MRRPRRLIPGSRWFITSRCAGARFRLRPDEKRKAIFESALGRALARYPGIKLHAAVQMSNHFHLVVTDEEGHLSYFMRDFLGPMARAINELDGTSGPLFERRFAATEIIDLDALLDRIAYTVANPVSANLVESPSDWPGLLLRPESSPRVGPESARPTTARVNLEDGRAMSCPVSHPEGRVPETPVVAWDSELQGLTAKLEDLISSRLIRSVQQRGGGSVLGQQAVLSTDVFDAPKFPSRGPLPLCHASSMELYQLFREGWRSFHDAYRRASAAFRQGVLDVAFPPHSFRPSSACA